MMSFEIVIDAKSPYHLAHFWAGALEGYQVRSYDQQEIDRLAKLGLTPETDISVPIDSEQGPTIWFQKSEDVAHVRNRLHFDLKFGNRESETKRLEAIGASVHLTREDHIVMFDPEGNQFCLFDS